MKTVEKVQYTRKRCQQKKLTPRPSHTLRSGQTLKRALQEYERQAFLSALSKTRGNKRQAPELLSIKYTTFHAACQRLDIAVLPSAGD